MVTNLAIIGALGLFAVQRLVGGAASESAVDTAALARFEGLAAEGQRIGPSDAPVAAVVFTDYQCPSCRSLERSLHALWGDSASAPFSIVVRHAPLSRIHPQAREAAHLAECAGMASAFARVHDALFAEVDAVRDRDWSSVLAAASVAPPTRDSILACLSAGGGLSSLQRDSAALGQLDFRGTPTLVFAQQVTAGAPTPELLAKMVAASIAVAHSER